MNHFWGRHFFCACVLCACNAILLHFFFSKMIHAMKKKYQDLITGLVAVLGIGIFVFYLNFVF